MYLDEKSIEKPSMGIQKNELQSQIFENDCSYDTNEKKSPKLDFFVRSEFIWIFCGVHLRRRKGRRTTLSAAAERKEKEEQVNRNWIKRGQFWCGGMPLSIPSRNSVILTTKAPAECIRESVRPIRKQIRAGLGNVASRSKSNFEISNNANAFNIKHSEILARRWACRFRSGQ